MATIAVLGTLDTKGHEHAFVADRIRDRGHDAILIDVGSGDAPQVTPDYSRDQVAAAAGISIADIASRRDRGECVTAMSKAAPEFLRSLVDPGQIDGVISLGGGGGTAIGTAAMRALPIGFPKLMVSTLASGNTQHYVGTKDIVMMPSVVDVAGLNRVTKTIFSRAAGAICGMVEQNLEQNSEDRPLIVASMFGNTTDCVNAAKEILEAAGYEVLIFHATGTGGQAMESLIESGMVTGVLDITTTEIADEIVGGVLTAGPNRLIAAGRSGLPTIVTPGCLDMVNFGQRDSVPDQFTGRTLYEHNPQVTLMRTSPEECKAIGERIANKLNDYAGPVSFLWPTRAISVISAEGQSFHDPEADSALHATIKSSLRDDIDFIEIDAEINSAQFAEACVHTLRCHMNSIADA